MSHDERADLVNRLDEDVVDEVLRRLAHAEREDIRRLAGYEPGTAGAVMTTDYADLPPDLTVREALDQLRRVAPDRETIYYSYVVDDNRRLLGLVSLKTLAPGPSARPARRGDEARPDRRPARRGPGERRPQDRGIRPARHPGARRRRPAGRHRHPRRRRRHPPPGADRGHPPLRRRGGRGRVGRGDLRPGQPRQVGPPADRLALAALRRRHAHRPGRPHVRRSRGHLPRRH